jgi:hypothetical protein
MSAPSYGIVMVFKGALYVPILVVAALLVGIALAGR